MQRLRLNNQIRASQVQVIGSTGEKLGIMPLHEALRLAQESNLDVVEVGPTAQPPLVKIIDYGKYQYQKERREKGGKASGQEIKTVQIGFRTEAHDLGVRSAQIDKFLSKGHRVKVEMKLRGREKGMVPLGKERFEQFLRLITENYDIDTPIKSFPGGIGMTVKPK